MNPLTALVLTGLAVTTLFAVAPQHPAAAQRRPAPIPNPQIDYPGLGEQEAERASESTLRQRPHPNTNAPRPHHRDAVPPATEKARLSAPH